MKDANRVQIMASDAGGTMTDMIVVDTRRQISASARQRPRLMISPWASGSPWRTPSNTGISISTKEARNYPPRCRGLRLQRHVDDERAAHRRPAGRSGVITQRGDEDVFLHERSAPDLGRVCLPGPSAPRDPPTQPAPGSTQAGERGLRPDRHVHDGGHPPLRG